MTNNTHSLVISNENPKDVYCAFFVSNSPSSYLPSIKIDATNNLYFIASYSHSTSRDCCAILSDIMSGNYGDLQSNIEYIRLSAIKLFENCSNLIKDIINNIDKEFFLADVVPDNLYNSIELKTEKTLSDNIQDKIKYIDLNVKFFIKNYRLYAGLKYLKDILSLISYGFGFSTNETKLVFYTSRVFWGVRHIDGIDNEGVVLNKIIEFLLMIYFSTAHSENIVELYKILQKTQIINLKSETLVKLIESLLKNNEKQLIECAIAELKKIEPRHPIIETANKTLRRIQVLNQISETFSINILDIQKLNGIEFEMFLENQFMKSGFKVERTKGSGDFGADLIIETASGTRASIQAKRYKQKANLKAVQEVVASLAHYQTDFGIVITTSGFFQSAVDLAETNNVELWDEDKLIQFLSGDFSFSMLSEN